MARAFALAGGMAALAVHAQDANSIWIAGQDGVLLVSSNGGGAWTVANTGSTRHLRALARSGSTGWAVGDGGTICAPAIPAAADRPGQRHAAGCAAWPAPTPSMPGPLAMAAWPWPRSTAASPGRRAPPAWRGSMPWPSPAHRTAWPVGQGGAIVRSADGGQTWAKVGSGSQATRVPWS